MAQLMNCAMEYIDGEETPTKKRKTQLGQASQQDAIQTVQECVGRYPRSKLGTRRVVKGAVLRGTVGRRQKTDRHANTIKFPRSDEVISMRPW